MANLNNNNNNTNNNKFFLNFLLKSNEMAVIAFEMLCQRNF